eukprot:CAMPEP_0119304274 /NCGR_PEP_ID=MMETSP1333-20130426/5538_1 /TAXON_ID=418940 /ORGANISM="Scyphosphaera apsteinii, Strain RCC1455" /LENGTH=61 /DNA_ID=CAMNT_0007307125 /DNA_START=223 /DNA_END=408 /DNA_ORIENTATION=-
MYNKPCKLGPQMRQGNPKGTGVGKQSDSSSDCNAMSRKITPKAMHVRVPPQLCEAQYLLDS